MIDEEYIKALMAIPIDLETDLNFFIIVAAEWGACESALKQLRRFNALVGCDHADRGIYVCWFYFAAVSRYENLGRWYEGERFLKEIPSSLADYMIHQPEIIPELEQFLLDGKYFAPLLKYAEVKYAGGGWEELEKLLLDYGDRSGFMDGIRYSIDVMKRRWPELEARILGFCGERWRIDYLERLRWNGLYDGDGE